MKIDCISTFQYRKYLFVHRPNETFLSKYIYKYIITSSFWDQFFELYYQISIRYGSVLISLFEVFFCSCTATPCLISKIPSCFQLLCNFLWYRIPHILFSLHNIIMAWRKKWILFSKKNSILVSSTMQV